MKKRQERIIADMWATLGRLECTCNFTAWNQSEDPTINQIVNTARNVQRAKKDVQRMAALLQLIWKPAQGESVAPDPDKAADLIQSQVYQYDVFPGGVYSSILSELAERYHREKVLQNGDNLFFLADLFALGVIHGKRSERARRKKAVSI